MRRSESASQDRNRQRRGDGPVEYTLAAGPETVRVGVLDRSFRPVLTVESGDVVVTQTLNGWLDEDRPQSTIEDFTRKRASRGAGVGPHTVTGPVAVRGARPGHTLRVDVLDLVPRPRGYVLHLPGELGTGLLSEFPDGWLRHLTFDLQAMTTEFGPGLHLPLRPFLGLMAVAPPGDPVSTKPAGPYGGNMDLPELVVGTTLFLPIWNDGALFSIGDAHARQGDGEVCLTAIETAMDRVSLRLSVLDSVSLERPLVETPDHWITMGFDEDLLEATRQAVRGMIWFLGRAVGMDPPEAYGFCSVAVDLAITKAVETVKGAHARVPKELLPVVEFG